MLLDFSVFFDRLGEQLTLLLLMLQRPAVQRQVLTVIVVVLVAALAPRVLRSLLQIWSTPRPSIEPAAAGKGAPAPPVTLHSRVLRGLEAIDFILFPVLLLLFTYRSIAWFDANRWPSGLIEGLLPIFWLLLVYRLLVRVVLRALPSDQSERFASELLRPLVLILILMIARNLLFSTLGLGEISLLRLGDLVLTLGALLDALIAVLLAFIVGGAVRKALLNVMVRSEVEPDVASTVSNVVRYAIVAAGALVAVGIFGTDLSGLAWIAGALVVGLGFGLQERSPTSSAALCWSSSASCAPATSSRWTARAAR